MQTMIEPLLSSNILLEVGCSPDYGYGDEGNYYNQEPQAGSSAPNQRYRGGGGP